MGLAPPKYHLRIVVWSMMAFVSLNISWKRTSSPIAIAKTAYLDLSFIALKDPATLLLSSKVDTVHILQSLSSNGFNM